MSIFAVYSDISKVWSLDSIQQQIIRQHSTHIGTSAETVADTKVVFKKPSNVSISGSIDNGVFAKNRGKKLWRIELF